MAKEKLVAKIDIETTRAMQALMAYRQSIKKADKDTEDFQNTSEKTGQKSGNAWKVVAGAVGTATVAMMAANEVLAAVARRQQEILSNAREFGQLASQDLIKYRELADLYGTQELRQQIDTLRAAQKFDVTEQQAIDVRFGLKSGGLASKQEQQAAFQFMRTTGSQGVAAGKAGAQGSKVFGFSAPEQQAQWFNMIRGAASESQITGGELAGVLARTGATGLQAGLTDIELTTLATYLSFYVAEPHRLGSSVEQILMATGRKSEKLIQLLTTAGIDPAEASPVDVLDVIVNEMERAKQGAGILGEGGVADLVKELGMPQELVRQIQKVGVSSKRKGLKHRITAAKTSGAMEADFGRRMRTMDTLTRQAELGGKVAEAKRNFMQLGATYYAHRARESWVEQGRDFELDIMKEVAGALSVLPGAKAFSEMSSEERKFAAEMVLEAHEDLQWARDQAERGLITSEELEGIEISYERSFGGMVEVNKKGPFVRSSKLWWMPGAGGRKLKPESFSGMANQMRAIRNRQARQATEPDPPPLTSDRMSILRETQKDSGLGFSIRQYENLDPATQAKYKQYPVDGRYYHQALWMGGIPGEINTTDPPPPTSAPISQTTPNVVNHQHFYGFTPINMKSRSDFYTPQGGNEWAN